MDWWWSWILTLTGVTTFFLAGKKVWWAWHVGLFVNQPIWLIYGIVSEQWGFIASTLFYTAVYSKNAWKWTVEHREEKESKRRIEAARAAGDALSFGFKIDVSKFQAGIGKAMKAMQKFEAKDVELTQALYSKFGGVRLNPSWNKRWFGWMWPWHPSTHWHKTCWCYNFRKKETIGRITKVEKAGDGVRVTSEIDMTTEAGRAMYDTIKGPPGQYSMGGTLKAAYPPLDSTYGGSVHEIGNYEEGDERAGDEKLQGDADSKRRGDS